MKSPLREVLLVVFAAISSPYRLSSLCPSLSLSYVRDLGFSPCRSRASMYFVAAWALKFSELWEDVSSMACAAEGSWWSTDRWSSDSSCVLLLPRPPLFYIGTTKQNRVQISSLESELLRNDRDSQKQVLKNLKQNKHQFTVR